MYPMALSVKLLQLCCIFVRLWFFWLTKSEGAVVCEEVSVNRSKLMMCLEMGLREQGCYCTIHAKEQLPGVQKTPTLKPQTGCSKFRPIAPSTLCANVCVPTQAVTETCPSGYIKGPGLCCKIYTNIADFHVAKFVCSSSHPQARLIILDSKAKFNSLIQTLKDNVDDIWVGGERGTDGFDFWLDGTPIDSSFWGKGEPNNFDNDENCLAIRSGKLNDGKCSGALSFVCEILIV